MSLNFLSETREFQTLVRSIQNNQAGLSAAGIIEPAKPYFLASLFKQTGKKIVFIRPSPTTLFPLESQLNFYLTRLAPGAKVCVLPQLAESPYYDVLPSLEARSSRMKFLYEIRYSLPDIVVTDIFGLLKPVPEHEILKKLFIEFGTGETYERDLLLEKLNEFGYDREDIVNSHGEYAWRGGIVDFFSPWSDLPVRLEFRGDLIASIREFDPATQKSVKRIDRIILPSVREFPVSSEFQNQWWQTAAKKGNECCRRDIAAKKECLQNRDYFPSFYFDSVLVSSSFVSPLELLKDYLLVIDDFDSVTENWAETMEEFLKQHLELKTQKKFSLSPTELFSQEDFDAIKKQALRLNELDVSKKQQVIYFPFQSIPFFENKIPFFIQYSKKAVDERERISIFFYKDGVRQKLSSLLSQHQIPYIQSDDPLQSFTREDIRLFLGGLEKGFAYPSQKIQFFSERDIFTEEKVLVSRRRIKPFVSQFQDLKSGNFVVHTDYGIGIFQGLVKMPVDGKSHEFIEIMYQDEDRLYVPVEDLNLVQKYSTMESKVPVLNKLGTPAWEKTKEKTKKAIQKLAKELLLLYAERKASTGYDFSQSGAWKEDFENTFEYEETDDQLQAITDISGDMESKSPMDRLLCGDVGYGKTEVAMRAAFKAVMDGKQVAILCPTTVLASQHLKTFRSRMVLFPINIEGLSRLQTRSRQKKIIEDLKQGRVDIVIGTHRLLSNDIKFSDLGLLIIDEEQRFGVGHKEKIKQMKTSVDVLTLTATPIPRTLNMALSGLRDISLIETPPKDRLAIHTIVSPFRRSLISSAIKKELTREGQVYFIHNRIDDIESMAAMIEKWVPEAKAVAVHGQMSSSSLEERMIDFISQKYNVLVSTTIIENGIDIPMVNTLIVNRADRFGLAQLYQLRGRVGRSSRQAFAYFLVPPYSDLTPLAKERLKALQEFTALGSGFRLAAKDLEIRGAGNFLGARQHGYMEAVGFDYYMHLLDKTVKELKGEIEPEVKSEINLRLDIRIPEEYLPQVNLRLNLYKRISSIDSLDEIDKIREEVTDRYGPPPKEMRILFLYGMVKFLTRQNKIKTLDRIQDKLVFKFLPSFSVDLNRLSDLLGKYRGSLTPQGIMSMKLKSGSDEEFMNETITILKELTFI